MFGVVLFGNILKWLFDNFALQTKFVFIGLILGSIPLLIKQANKGKIQFKYVIFLFISFLISLFLIFWGNYIPSIYENNLNCIYLFVCGFVMSIGVVVPRC